MEETSSLHASPHTLPLSGDAVFNSWMWYFQREVKHMQITMQVSALWLTTKLLPFSRQLLSRSSRRKSWRCQHNWLRHHKHIHSITKPYNSKVTAWWDCWPGAILCMQYSSQCSSHCTYPQCHTCKRSARVCQALMQMCPCWLKYMYRHIFVLHIIIPIFCLLPLASWVYHLCSSLFLCYWTLPHFCLLSANVVVWGTCEICS